MKGHSDAAGARLGMWLFLYTEIMLFSGLFVLYAAYYYGHTGDFTKGSGRLDVAIGTANTVILLVSSFLVAAAVNAVERREKRPAVVMLGASASLGAVFLVNKYFEWSHKIAVGIFPTSEKLLAMPKGEVAFFNLYYFLTGLHALHVIAGMTLLVISLISVLRSADPGEKAVLADNAGLYWHLVDTIWIFLFPLFYLIS